MRVESPLQASLSTPLQALCPEGFLSDGPGNFSATGMTILDKLASSLNRRDEVPNQQLAMQIVDGNDEKAVKELVRNLRNRDREIQRSEERRVGKERKQE